jgi:SAM-dependent methyltransferase
LPPSSDPTVGPAVLEFYRTLPFNMRETAEGEAAAIQAADVVGSSYPLLPEHLSPGARVLEIGCGTGWLSNSIAVHYDCQVTGVDFNPVAIGRARETAALLGAGTTFIVSDLTGFDPPAPFDVVVSNGVLHHTADCLGALERLLTRFVAPGGVAMIGLYHLHGRTPFLDHFEQMRAKGATEDQLLDRYAQLHPQLANDRQHLLSWYRDQVCHPFETQHTLEEVLPILDKAGMTLLSTSINRFQPFDDVRDVVALEPAMAATSRERLASNQYYPGFFLFSARKDR